MTKQQLEKTVKDLRTRISNAFAKKEIMEESFKEQLCTLEKRLAEQDSVVKMLQSTIVARDK
jgi:archaellum component FlaC